MMMLNKRKKLNYECSRTFSQKFGELWQKNGYDLLHAWRMARARAAITISIKWHIPPRCWLFFTRESGVVRIKIIAKITLRVRL